MQVSVETTSSLERRLTIGVPSEQIDSEVAVRLKKASGNVRLDGFRQGKVPFKVLKQRFGAGVRQEVIGEVMQKSFYDAIMQENLKPAGQPTIEPKVFEEGKDLEFIATFEVYPEVELGDYAAIEVEKLSAEITEDDIEKMIEALRTQAATWEKVDREAQQGDQLLIDFTGTRDGEEFEGGSATDHELVLGSNRMIPGFEDGLVGASAGDSKTLELTFPEDYHSEDLKGAAVQFQVQVKQVKEQKLASLDDEFFARFGVTEGGEEAFRAEVKGNMERELRNATTLKLKNQVMDGILAGNEIEIPGALVEGEIKVLRGQMVQQFGSSAAQFDQSMLPDDMFREQAEKRVRLGLLLAEIISKEKIEADADKVRAVIDEQAASYEDPEQVVNWYYGNEENLQPVKSMVLEDCVVEKILESAKVTDRQCSYEEAVKQDAPAS
jgi:trigger factor